jgi:hypothetical protein
MHTTKGAVNVRTLLTTTKDLEDTFGRPNDTNFTHWFTAEAFLKQSNQLYAVRIEDSTKAVAGLTVGVSGINTITDATSKKVSDFPLGYDVIKTNEAKKDYSLTPGTSAGQLDHPANNLLTNETYHFYGVGPGTTYSGISVCVVNSTDWAVVRDFRDDINQASNTEEQNTIASNYYNGIIGNDYLSDSLIKYDLITPPSISGGNWTVDFGFLNSLTSTEYGPATADEAMLYVFDEFNNLAEQYLFSNDPTKKDEQGAFMFGPQIVNRNSNLIYFFMGSDEATSASIPHITGEVPGSGLGDLTGEILTAWQEHFSNVEDVEVDLLIDADYNDNVKRYIDQLSKEIRKDCFAILNVPKSVIMNVLTNKPVAQPYTSMKDYVSRDLNINSSYSAIYGNYFKIYDRFAEKERWVPCSGYVAAVMAFTDFSAAQWFAPAGLNRGIISNVIDVAVNPNKGQRDILYYNRINPIANFIGEGITIWGQKTLQSKASAFDRINVRRLFLYLEKAVKKMARYYLFEFNDDFTRSRFRGTVNPFLSEVKARRGVFDYLVVCDESNNTAEVIDRNEFRAEILVKPARAIEFIKLTFSAVGTGVEFTEVVERLA